MVTALAAVQLTMLTFNGLYKDQGVSSQADAENKAALSNICLSYISCTLRMKAIYISFDFIAQVPG